MTHETQSPVHACQRHRAIDANALSRATDRSEAIANGLSFQAAHVAARYRLSPCIARLVCFLADIGGRFS